MSGRGWLATVLGHRHDPSAVWAGVGDDRVARWGRIIAGVGVIGLAAGLPFKIAAMTVPLGLVFLGLALARAQLQRVPGLWPALALVVWGVGAIAVVHGPGAVGRLGFLYAGLAFPLAVAALGATPWAWRGALIALVGGVLVHALLGILQFTIGYDAEAPLQISPEGSHFDLAPGLRFGNVGPSIYAAGVLLALAAAARSGSGLPRWWRYAGQIAAGASVLMNKSRGVWLAVAGAVVLWRIDRKRRLAIGIVIALALMVVGGALVYWRSPERIEDVISGDEHRFAMWRFGCAEVAERPLFGHGGQRAFTQGSGVDSAGAIAVADIETRWAERMEGREMDPNMRANLHNTPLNYAVFVGLPGAVLHLLFLLAIGLACWRTARHGGHALGVWAFVVTCGMFDATFVSQRTAYTVSLLLAIAWCADHRRELIERSADAEDEPAPPA